MKIEINMGNGRIVRGKVISYYFVGYFNKWLHNELV